MNLLTRDEFEELFDLQKYGEYKKMYESFHRELANSEMFKATIRKRNLLIKQLRQRIIEVEGVLKNKSQQLKDLLYEYPDA